MTITERLYHLISINTKTMAETVMTRYPDTHQHCMTMKRKLTVYPNRTITVKEV